MEEKKVEAAPASAPAPAAEAAEVAENGTNAAPEVTSTTQNEPTKRSLRVDTWKKIRQNRCGVALNSIFNRIPSFVNSEKAAELLAETDEFKNAKKVRVNIARALNSVKLQALIHDKELYLPATRDSTALYLRVDVPADANEEQKKAILQDFQKHRTEINFDNKVEFDLVVIGAVVVSHEGYCIGRGNGFIDQDLAFLIEIGSITPKTLIATIVHDQQVVETLPTDLFQKHDVPVDLIVTPTQVIRVEKRLPRPTGFFWELLSERRLKLSPPLQALKEKQEAEGKVIALKPEDTDIEQNANYRRRRPPVRRRFQRRFPRRRTQSQTDTEQQGDNAQQQKRAVRRQRKFNPRRRRQTKSEGDQSGPEGKSQERRQDGQSNDRRKAPRARKNRPSRDFCIKLSNLGRGLRVTDLKQELRRRECKPLYITWKGQFGKCLLHFGKRTGEPSSDDEIDKVMKALSGMQITIPTGGNNNNVENGQGDEVKAAKTKTFNVNVELIKFTSKDQPQTNGETAPVTNDANNARIESVDTTTV